ncbi:unnamed protein product, partial [Sphenostylis stenocarpa]
MKPESLVIGGQPYGGEFVPGPCTHGLWELAMPEVVTLTARRGMPKAGLVTGDLRVSKVVPGGSLNAFLFLLIGVISQRLVMVKKKGEQAHLESTVQRIVNQSGPETQWFTLWRMLAAVAWLREITGAVAKASLHRAIVTAYGPEPGSASETMWDKLHRREGNNPNHQLRPLNNCSVIEEVGEQRQPGGEHSALEGRTRASSAGRSGSENVGLSNANVGENPMPRKPKGSSARFIHRGSPQS